VILTFLALVLIFCRFFIISIPKFSVPHIVLDHKLNIFDFSILFKPIFQKSPLVKIQNMYVDSDGHTALFSTHVNDASHCEFFIQILTKENTTTIRLFPLTDPNKTDSVKQSLVFLCKQIQENYPNMNVIKSNLWDYIT